MITTVLIDIDDTLIDFDKSAEGAIKQMFEKYGYPVCDNIMEIYYEISRPLWEKVGRMEMTGNELRRIRWQLILDRLGIEGDGTSLERDYHLFLAEQWPLIDGARELVEYLSSKYTLCAASNAPKDQQGARLKGAGLLKYFSFIFESGEIGFDKPVLNFFKICLKRAGNVKPQQAIMIGDNPDADIFGGKNAGMKTCFYNSTNKQNTANADYVVSSLSEIMQIL